MPDALTAPTLTGERETYAMVSRSALLPERMVVERHAHCTGQIIVQADDFGAPAGVCTDCNAPFRLSVIVRYEEVRP